MRRGKLLLLLALLALAACGQGAAPDGAPAGNTRPAASAGGIQVSDVWARQAMGSMSMGEGGANGAVYMTIRNMSGAPEKLLKAESAVAKSIELHTMADNNGVMQMRPVAAIDIPANGEVQLKPGGFHVMLIGLTKDLKAGDKLPLKLTFEKAGTLDVTAEVRAS
jgi:copper(I)-binding protein